MLAGQHRGEIADNNFPLTQYGVDDQESYPARLDAMLPDTDVVNLGVTAFGLPQEIRYFELEGRKYQPDVVVVGRETRVRLGKLAATSGRGSHGRRHRHRP